MSDRLTIDEAIQAFPNNPEASAMVLGLVLQQAMHEDANCVSNMVTEMQERRIAELERKLAYWEPLGRKYLAAQSFLRGIIFEEEPRL